MAWNNYRGGGGNSSWNGHNDSGNQQWGRDSRDSWQKEDNQGRGQQKQDNWSSSSWEANAWDQKDWKANGQDQQSQDPWANYTKGVASQPEKDDWKSHRGGREDKWGGGGSRQEDKWGGGGGRAQQEDKWGGGGGRQDNSWGSSQNQDDNSWSGGRHQDNSWNGAQNKEDHWSQADDPWSNYAKNKAGRGQDNDRREDSWNGRSGGGQENHRHEDPWNSRGRGAQDRQRGQQSRDQGGWGQSHQESKSWNARSSRDEESNSWNARSSRDEAPWASSSWDQKNDHHEEPWSASHGHNDHQDTGESWSQWNKRGERQESRGSQNGWGNDETWDKAEEGDPWSSWKGNSQSQNKWEQDARHAEWDGVNQWATQLLEQEVDWTQRPEVEVNKNFYEECAHASAINRPEAEVERIREDDGIEVIKSDDDDLPIPNVINSFDEACWGSELMQALTDDGFQAPTPIQKQIWPLALQGRDVVGIAETGSGKTVAYVLPMVFHILRQAELEPGDGPIGVILAPTRELAKQIEGVCDHYGGLQSLKATNIVGGTKIVEQKQMLQETNHIIVATPGRLSHALGEDWTQLNRVTFVVLDEADEILKKNGFEHETRAILSQVRKDRQVLMFSATWPQDVQDLAKEICLASNGQPVQVRIGGTKLAACKNIVQKTILTEGDEDKYEKLKAQLLEMKVLEVPWQGDKCIIFCRRRDSVQQLYEQLGNEDFAWRQTDNGMVQLVQRMHGEQHQSERDWVMSQFRDDELPVVISTGVLARGHDIPRVKYVINYEMPKLAEDYIHRVGRTGRAGHRGYALTFVNNHPKDLEWGHEYLTHVLQATGQEIDTDLQEKIKEHQSQKDSWGDGNWNSSWKEAYTMTFDGAKEDMPDEDIYNIAKNLAGDYEEEEENHHGQKAYVKKGDNGEDAYLYYYDERDGDDAQGWYLAPEMGGTAVWSHSCGDGSSGPPAGGWTIPAFADYVCPCLKLAPKEQAETSWKGWGEQAWENEATGQTSTEAYSKPQGGEDPSGNHDGTEAPGQTSTEAYSAANAPASEWKEEKTPTQERTTLRADAAEFKAQGLYASYDYMDPSVQPQDPAAAVPDVPLGDDFNQHWDAMTMDPYGTGTEGQAAGGITYAPLEATQDGYYDAYGANFYPVEGYRPAPGLEEPGQATFPAQGAPAAVAAAEFAEISADPFSVTSVGQAGHTDAGFATEEADPDVSISKQQEWSTFWAPTESPAKENEAVSVPETCKVFKLDEPKVEEPAAAGDDTQKMEPESIAEAPTKMEPENSAEAPAEVVSPAPDSATAPEAAPAPPEVAAESNEALAAAEPASNDPAAATTDPSRAHEEEPPASTEPAAVAEAPVSPTHGLLSRELEMEKEPAPAGEQKPDEEPAHAPAEQPLDEEPAHAPAEKALDEEPAHAPAEKALDEEPAHAPAEQPLDEEPAHAPAEQPLDEEPAHAPAQQKLDEEPAHAPAEQPLDEEPAHAPAEKALDEESFEFEEDSSAEPLATTEPQATDVTETTPSQEELPVEPEAAPVQEDGFL